MRTTAVVIALFLVGIAGMTRPPAAPAQTGEGWTTLFNGKNLDNWEKTGNANWRVVDGMIEADMPRGFLLTKESYGDFDLRADIWATPTPTAVCCSASRIPRIPGSRTDMS